MPPAGFESSIPASERWHTNVLNRVATAITVQYFMLHCTHKVPGYYILIDGGLSINICHVIKRFK